MTVKKKDVLEDDGDDGLENRADDAAAEKVKAKAQEAEDDGPEPSEPVEVDLDKAEDELEPATDEQRESRRDRRRNRWREMQDERAAAVRRAEEAERRETATRELVLRMQQHMVPQQPRQPEADPLEQELDQALEEQRLLYAEFDGRVRQSQGQVAPELEQTFRQKARALQRKMLLLGGKMAMREQGQGVDAEQVKRQVVQEQMMQAHGDVLGSENTRMYCDGVWRQLRAKGKPDSWETLEEAAEITRREFGLASRSRRPPPSDASKRRLTGMSRGGGSASGSETARVVTLTPEHKRMANAMYKHLPNERERYQRWAAGPGKRLLEKRA